MGKNPFKAIKKVTDKVNSGFKSVGKEFKKIGEVLKCPISIFSNIPKCGLYYIEDLIVLLIWFILWLICFIVLYLPIAFFMQIYCALGGVYLCQTVEYKYICPSKQFISELIELCFKFFGMRILLRSGDDVKKCYCVSPMKMAFQPLLKMKYTGALTSNGEKSYSIRLFFAIFAISCIFAVNAYGYKPE